jgi:hypothetical protein
MNSTDCNFKATLEVLDDTAAPIPPHQISLGLTDGCKIKSSNTLPDTDDAGEEKEEADTRTSSPEPEQDNPASTNNISGQQQHNIIVVPEATLVVDPSENDESWSPSEDDEWQEDSLSVYNAVLVTNRKGSLLIGALLFFFVSIGTITGLAIKNKQTDSMPTPAPSSILFVPISFVPISSETPLQEPTLEPTKETCSPLERCKYIFIERLQQIEKELYLFRDEIVRVHSLPCDEKMLIDCSNNNYNSCESEFPDKKCVPEKVTLYATNQTCDGG